MSEVAVLGRRAVLASAGLAGLVVAVGSPLAARANPAEAPSQLGAFIRIGPDGGVIVVAPCFELGQGSSTGLAMIVADELGADWARVAVETPPLDPAYRVPGRPVQSTSGCQIARRWFVPLRKAAPVARAMLTEAAARRWSVDPATCTVSNGRVLHAATGRSVPFGDLAAAAASLPPPQDASLRTAFTVRAARRDRRSQVAGSRRHRCG